MLGGSAWCFQMGSTPQVGGQMGRQWNEGDTSTPPAQLLEKRDIPSQATQFPGHEECASGQTLYFSELTDYREQSRRCQTLEQVRRWDGECVVRAGLSESE